MSKVIEIEKLVYGGYGLGHLKGKAIFVPYAAPGDKLEIEIVKKHAGYNLAEIQKIVEPAGCRTKPKCKYYGKCGGCQLQHVGYVTQILWKQKILEEQLKRIAGIEDPRVLPVISSPKQWNYRSRIQVHKRDAEIGFLKKESDVVVDINYCDIADSEVNKKLTTIRENWPEGEGRVELSIDESDSFTQVNPAANEKLKSVILEWIRQEKVWNVLELYAGSGNFTVPLAETVNEITAVESDEKAVEKLKARSSELSGAGIITAICAKVEEYFFLDEYSEGPSEPSLTNYFGAIALRDTRKYDLVLVDPPREGLSKNIISSICDTKALRIIYVSCDPSTLARDLKDFIKAGYTLLKTQPVDMFPQTYHIESVSELGKI